MKELSNGTRLARGATVRRLSPKPFSVELSATAWRDIGSLSGGEFNAVRAQLDLLAATPHPVLEEEFEVQGLRGRCERDPARRVLRLLELVRVG